MTNDPTSESGEGLKGVTSQQLRSLFQESMYWSPQQMRHFQLSQLEQLVRHAWTHVPFYTDRLRCLIRPDGSIDLSRWSEVPIVKRKDLQQQRVLMLAPHLPPGHGGHWTSRTSGSSGHPISIDVSSLAKLVATVAWDRAYRLHGFPVELGTAEFQAFLPSGEPMEVPFLVEEATELRGKRTILNRKLSTVEKLDLLAELKIVFLSDTPNHAEVLARENLRRKSRVRLNAFVGIGMHLSREQGNLITDSFGARTFSPYSSTECGLIAFQCPGNRSSFHINSELVLLEILDPNDKPVPPGQPGRVVVTPIFNAAQPLIRYEQGDIAVLGESCMCGLRLPTLREISGRVDDMFYVAGRKVAFNHIDERMVRDMLKADAIQFAQVSPEHVSIRYVSGRDADEPTKAAIARHTRVMLGTANITVTFHRMEEIPSNAGGKQQRIKREFDLP